jgi:hypothetical protein
MLEVWHEVSLTLQLCSLGTSWKLHTKLERMSLSLELITKVKPNWGLEVCLFRSEFNFENKVRS